MGRAGFCEFFFILLVLLIFGPDLQQTFEMVSGNCMDDGTNFGPDLVPCETRHCSADSSADSTVEDGSLEDHESTELITVKEENDFFRTLYEGMTNGVAAVYSAGDHLYSTVSTITSEFANKVRDILRDDLIEILSGSITNIFESATGPGTKLHSLGVTALTAIVIILCICLNLIFYNIFPKFTLLAFDCFILLIHHFMGPKFILDLFYSILGIFYQISLFCVYHYYISSFSVIALFLFSLLYPLIKWTIHRNQPERMELIAEEVFRVSNKIDQIEAKIDEILECLCELKKCTTS